MEYLKDLDGLLCVVDGACVIGSSMGADNLGGFISNGRIVGVFTGYYDELSNGGMWYQIRSAEPGVNGVCYIQGDLKSKAPAASYSRNDAQEMLNKVLQDHKFIMQNLEVAAMYTQNNPQLANAEFKGWGYSANQMIAYMYQRLRERENDLIDDDMIESSQTGYNGGAYTAGQEALDNVVRNTRINGVGAIPAVAIYIIVAVVSVAVGAWLYYKLTNMKKAADYDLNLSNEFLNWLKKQSPETTKIVLDQLKATGDSAYKAALNEKGTGLVNWIKNAGSGVKFALMAAGAFLVWTQVDKMQTNKAKRKFKYGR